MANFIVKMLMFNIKNIRIPYSRVKKLCSGVEISSEPTHTSSRCSIVNCPHAKMTQGQFTIANAYCKRSPYCKLSPLPKSWI